MLTWDCLRYIAHLPEAHETEQFEVLLCFWVHRLVLSMLSWRAQTSHTCIQTVPFQHWLQMCWEMIVNVCDAVGR